MSSSRALCVGINAYPSAPLQGCLNDMTDMARWLVSSAGFAQGDVRLLADARATTAAIVERLHWLVDGLRPGDRAVFSFSGHGARMTPRDHIAGLTGTHESTVPYDFNWELPHMLLDTQFHALFAKIPAGADFVWISDNCHSGDMEKTLLRPGVRARHLVPPPDLAWRTETALAAKRPSLALGVDPDFHGVLIAACQATETAADASFHGRPNGALTRLLLDRLAKPSERGVPLTTLALDLAKDMQAQGYAQHPRIVGSAARLAQPLFAHAAP